MKKLVTAAVLAVSLTFAGCAAIDNIRSGVELVTGSYNNPITKNELYAFENSLTLVFVGLNAYKKSCLKGAVDTNCKANIRTMQIYTKQLPPLLAQTRAFVKDNDQVNAQIIFNQAKQLYAQLKSFAAEKGVPL